MSCSQCDPSKVFEKHEYLHGIFNIENTELMNSAMSRFAAAILPDIYRKQSIIEANIGVPITRFQVLCIMQWGVGHPFGQGISDADWLKLYLKFVTKFGNPVFEE